MPFTPKDWRNAPETSTPISAAALEDLETRLSDYTDDAGGGGGSLQTLTDVTGAPTGTGRTVPTWNGSAFEFAARGPRINVHDYGALGDGTTLDNTAFINAIAAAGTLAGANGTCTVFCRPGAVYKLTGGNSVQRFMLPSGVTVDLNGSTCSFATSGDFTIGFGSDGTLAASGVGYEFVSADVLRGTWEITCANASEFADGDWVLIASEGDEGAGTGKKGEIARVVVPTGTCAAMDASQTTITLGATGGNLFGNTNSTGGRVQIGSELIDYTDGAISTITGCTRGVGGTTAATHVGGSDVTFVPGATQVLLMHRISHEHGYTVADAAKIRTISMVKNVGIKNGKIIGPGNVGGLAFKATSFQYCVGVRVEDVTFENCNSVNVAFSSVVHGLVDGCSMYKSILANPTSANLGYGILLIDACQDCTLSNNHVLRMRHCVSQGNASYGYPRRNIFVGNHFLYASGDAVDSHLPVDDFHFVGNVIIGGANGLVVRSPQVTVVGNHIQYTNGPGIQCHFAHESPVRWIIEDNKFDRCCSTGTTAAIVVNQDAVAADGADFINVSGNSIVCSPGAGGIAMGYASGTKREGVLIEGNIVANCPTGIHAIDVGGFQGAVIANNVINAPHINSKGIFLSNSDKISVTGNNVHYTSVGTGVAFDFDNCDDVSVVGNIANNALTGINVRATSDYFRMSANNTRGCTTPVNLNGIVTHVGDSDGPMTTIASAATVTLPSEGSVFTISGTTAITSVTASWAGRVVTLVFSGTAAAAGLTDGSNLKLASSFAHTGDDAITLASDGTNWYETARSVN